jgi:negative regulator of flagellin synthesis FlgM
MNIRSGIEDLSPILPSQSVASAPAARGSIASQNESLNSDQAQLSVLATGVTQSTAISDVRLDKVANIQNALQSGTYQVSSADVAQKIIASMMEPEK